MIGDTTSTNERRDNSRFGINAPLTVKIGEHNIPAFTRDLSNRGVYFYLDSADSALIHGDIEFIVELPPEVTLTTCCLIRCQGRVVRAENTESNLTGIAAEILHYSMQREETLREEVLSD